MRACEGICLEDLGKSQTSSRMPVSLDQAAALLGKLMQGEPSDDTLWQHPVSSHPASGRGTRQMQQGRSHAALTNSAPVSTHVWLKPSQRVKPRLQFGHRYQVPFSACSLNSSPCAQAMSALTRAKLVVPG